MSPADVTTAERPLEAVPTSEASLAVSTASKTKKGDIQLRFAIPEGGSTVECTRIKVTIPVGAAATDLTSNPGSIKRGSTSSKGNWSIQATDGGDSYTITCNPPGVPAPKFVFDDTAWFVLRLESIPVSRLPGEVGLTIDATLRTLDTLSTPASADTTTAEDWIVPITKSIDDFFFLRSFSCERPQVTNGGTATLRWEGSEHDTEYYLHYGEHVGDQAIPVEGQSEQVKNLTDTTTFVLEARNTSADGEPHYLSTTVTVKEPTIVAKSLTASAEIKVPGTFTADGGTRTTTAFGPTFFEGDVTIMANNKLTVNGAIRSDNGTVAVDGALNATGTLNAGAATVSSLNAQSGAITTSGTLNAGAATVSTFNAGAATVSSLNAQGGAITTSGTLNAGAATVSSLNAQNGAIQTNGTLKGGATTISSLTASSAAITGNITASNGKRVIRVDDRIELEVNSHDKKLYLYCQTGNKDNVYGGANDIYLNAKWRVHYYRASRDLSDGPDGPDVAAEPDA